MIRKIFTPKSKKVLISIPPEYVNHPIEILLFQLKENEKADSEIEYWSEEELKDFSSLVLTSDIDDNEDYSKW
jgi:hypothetical protein